MKKGPDFKHLKVAVSNGNETTGLGKIEVLSPALAIFDLVRNTDKDGEDLIDQIDEEIKRYPTKIKDTDKVREDVVRMIYEARIEDAESQPDPAEVFDALHENLHATARYGVGGSRENVYRTLGKVARSLGVRHTNMPPRSSSAPPSDPPPLAPDGTDG